MAAASDKDEQQPLADLWLKTKRGRLPPWAEAKAWALREAWREFKPDSTYGLLEFVATRVEKQGGKAPTASAISQLFDKFDSDPSWFPGKVYGSYGGSRPALNGRSQAAIASAAMALKRDGLEPTFPLVVAQCPQASLNPATGRTVAPKRVYDVMREKCFDESEDRPWKHRARLSKTMLTEEEEEARRLRYGRLVQSFRHTDTYYENKLVWSDICNTILPRTVKRAQQQAQARKGGKGWISDGSQEKSINLRGPKESLKQNSWDSVRFWWAPVLLRDKVHVELLGTEFPGETPAGAAILVQKIRAAINIRCRGDDKPNVLMVDRGKGFYSPQQGKIQSLFAAALREHGLKPFMGADASQQPGSLQELMLHETVVSWARRRLTLTTPKRPWDETVEQYGNRLQAAFRYINEHHDVEGLSKEFPQRIQTLIDNQGGKLAK